MRARSVRIDRPGDRSAHEPGSGQLNHEVVVMGGGAAGCGAAGLLSRLGHDVALIRPSRAAAAELAQSIPPSAEKLLLELGLLAGLEQGGFQRNSGNTVWWAGAPARVEAFESGRTGFHVDRAGLEEVATAMARSSGVHIHDGVARLAHEHDGRWVVKCDLEGGGALVLAAPWLLDATGRRGFVAVREGRDLDRETSTLAILRRWRRSGNSSFVDSTHTLVESYARGWVWSVPLAEDVRCFAAMIDGAHPSAPGRDATARGLGEVLDAALAECPEVGVFTRDAEPLGEAWACPASLYTSRRFARPGLLLVGDAGSFIDPLSSFGIKKALGSGWRAAVAVHTALSDRSMQDVAVRFFDDHERAVYTAYRRASADFFESCARVYGEPYWSRRAAAARAASHSEDSGSRQPEAVGQRLGPVDPDDVEGSGVDAEKCRRALDVIRTRASLDARLGSGARIVARPLVLGHRLSLAEHLATDLVPQGLRWVRNVDILRLVEVAPRHADVSDGWAAYNGGGLPVALPDYLAALATAFAAGLLTHDGG